MSAETDNIEFFTALVRRHEATIRKVAAAYYALESYSYRELVNDLTTYLWLVYRDLPSGTVIRDERAWVYVILYRRTRDLVRSEQTYQRKLVYGADLSKLADEGGQPAEVSRLYRLVSMLDQDDRELILMFIDRVPIKQIAAVRGVSLLSIYRRIAAIRNKLRRMDSEVEEDDEYQPPPDREEDETEPKE